MVEVEKLSQHLHSLLDLLISQKAEYLAQYTLKKGQGFWLHFHPEATEFIVLQSGSFILKHGEDRKSIEEIKLDANNDVLLVVIPKKVFHTLKGAADNSRYTVIKQFNDAMLP